MPEGPEVFRIGQRVRDSVTDQELESIHFYKTDETRIVGARVIEVATKGKKLIIRLDNGYSILVSFVLGGKLEYDSEGKGPIASMLFTDGLKITLTDGQKLATLFYDTNNTVDGLLPKGFDPMHTICGMREWFALCRSKPRQFITKFLVNQDHVAGIGNRYKSEILHVSNILPNSRMSSLSEEQMEFLLINIYRVLKCASREDYVFTVYGRKTSLPEGLPVFRKEISKGDLVWTTFSDVIPFSRASRKVAPENTEVQDQTT